MDQTQNRVAIIDFARTASILAVLCFHFCVSDKGQSIPGFPFLSSLLENISKNGRYGVTMFFVISGFVVSRMISARYGSLYSVDSRDFYIRRIARIWPLFITTIIIGLIVVIKWSSLNLPIQSSCYNVFSPDAKLFDWVFFVSLITMVFNWLLFLRPSQYGLHWTVLWSLAIEEQFYFLFPLILRYLNSNKKLVTMLVLLIVLGPVSRGIGLLGGYSVGVLQNSFGAFDLIAMGVLLFIVHQRVIERLKLIKVLPQAVCLLASLGVLTVYLGTDFHNSYHVIFGPTLLGATLCLFFLGGLAWPNPPVIPSFLTFPGKLSYGMYIYHPLCALLTVCFLSLPKGILEFTGYVGVTMALSAASFYMYEQPINRCICKKFIPSLLIQNKI